VEEHTTTLEAATEGLDGQPEGGGTSSFDFVGPLELTILSKKKRIVSSKDPAKSSEAVPPPSSCPSKTSAATFGFVVCSSTTDSVCDSSFNPVKFVEDKLKCAGDIDRIQSLSIEESRNYNK
jgi:hypothetical protein